MFTLGPYYSHNICNFSTKTNNVQILMFGFHSDTDKKVTFNLFPFAIKLKHADSSTHELPDDFSIKRNICVFFNTVYSRYLLKFTILETEQCETK